MPNPTVNQILRNPSPKGRFRELPENLTKHRNLVDLPEFQKAADFAMLEYQTRVTKQITDGQTAMAAGLKIQGALELLQEFRLLSETATMPTPSIVEPLNHRA